MENSKPIKSSNETKKIKERNKVMKTKESIFDYFGSKVSSADPVLCTEPLTILPEFDSICNPVNIDRNADGPMGELGIDPVKAEERKVLRKQLLKEHIETTQTVAPFIVWRRGKDHVIVDARHEEYRIACEIELPISIIEFKFSHQDEAFAFMAMHQLNRPNLNAPQRMLLVRRLEEIVKKLAKDNQGKRNDIASEKSNKKVHTKKILAALANVGENSLRRFYKVIDEGAKYLGEDKAKELVERILAETLSINNANNRLTEAIKKKNAKDGFANNNPELFPKADGSNDDGKDEEIVTYENPSLENCCHNKIVCGDRVSVAKHLPDAWANLICMSPEYNVNRIKYDVPIPVLPFYEYLEKLNTLWIECARVLRDGGRLVINLPALVSVFKENNHKPFNTPLFMDVINEIEKLDIGLNLRDILIWHKAYPTRRHHMSSPSFKNPCYSAEHEYLLIFSKKDWEMAPENEGAPSDLTEEIYKDFSSSVCSIAPQSKGVGNHPAVFPEALVERIIHMHSAVGDTVCDFSNGSGTSTAVAARLGRRWFGCDISPHYCKVANNRTQKAHKQFLKALEDNKEQVNTKKAA